MLHRSVFAITISFLFVSRSALAQPPATSQPPVASPEVATVHVEVDVPDAEVSLDGRALGRSPLAGPVSVAPGRHAFVAKFEDREPARAEVEVRAGQSTAIVLRVIRLRDDTIGYDAAVDTAGGTRIALLDPSAKSMPLLIAGGSLAGVAFVTAIALNVAANAKANEARALQSSIETGGGDTTSCSAPAASRIERCLSLHDALTKRDSYANAALVGYFVTGVASAVTIAYAFWPVKRETKPAFFSSMRPAPMIGAGTGGLQIAGSF